MKQILIIFVALMLIGCGEVSQEQQEATDIKEHVSRTRIPFHLSFDTKIGYPSEYWVIVSSIRGPLRILSIMRNGKVPLKWTSSWGMANAYPPPQDSLPKTIGSTDILYFMDYDSANTHELIISTNKGKYRFDVAMDKITKLK